MPTEITLPLSQARRRLNQIFRHLEKHPHDVYRITCKGKPKVYIISAANYNALTSLVNDLEKELPDQ